MVFRALVLAALLAALWLLLSGYWYKPLLLGLGAVSVLASVLLVMRLGLLEQPSTWQDFAVLRLLRYTAWLTVEIGRADWAVTKVILSASPDLRQRLFAVPCGQGTDLGRTLFANSITITPGTVTVETQGDRLIVHALTDEAADLDALAAMGARVAALEAPSNPRRTAA